MNILIITHYYPPEIGAPQARLSEMANAWIALGHEVTVVTCFPNHPTGVIPENYQAAYKSRRYMEEDLDGVNVKRCWVYATPNKGFLKKILGHLSFMISAVVQGGRNARHADVIVVSSPTFFSVISAWWLGLRYGTPYIFDVRDLWPAIFVELGILKNRLIIGILEWIEMFLYRHAAAVVTVTRRFTENIVSRGIPAKKVHVITNGVDLTRFSPREKDEALLDEIGLKDTFIVLYIGAHGISHALSRIVDAADNTNDNPGIHYLFVGEGAEKEKIQAHAKALGLNNVTFLPGQPKERMVSFYSIADVCLVPLRNIPLFDTFIPSKMFEIMGMEKPIVASVRGEAAEILESSGGSLVCSPEDADAIAKAIITLHGNKTLRTDLGTRGRAFVEANYSRAKLAESYLSILKQSVS